MALILKRTAEMGETQWLYDSSQQDQLVIAGLGNPGDQYADNRHNLGWQCLDFYLQKQSPDQSFSLKPKLNCQLATLNRGNYQVRLVKPVSFMNNSGPALARLLDYYRLTAASLWVIYDDVRLKWGQLALEQGQSSSSHNGLYSIHRSLAGAGFGRLAIGIGPKKPARIDLTNFVLADFSDQEKQQRPAVLTTVGGLIDEITTGSVALGNCQAFI